MICYASLDTYNFLHTEVCSLRKFYFMTGETERTEEHLKY